MDGRMDRRTHTVIIVHICGSCNFVISVRKGFPLPLGELERLHNFIVALTGPSMYVISIHLAPGIVIESWDFS